jgi:iron complex transport system ATP-binding protein
MPAVLQAQSLSLAYDDALIIKELNLELPKGKITALVGPNGCGKSTLLKGLARLLKPKAGSVLLGGKAIHQLKTRDLAKILGILPQGPQAPEGLTVRELVAQGRYPHQSWLQQWSTDDEGAVEHALELTHMNTLADRPVDALSGGQRQRAWIAMTLAQETSLLLLDEPTTFLDLAHQLEVLELLKKLNGQGRTVVMVLHDINQATRYAHHLVALKAGHVVAQGKPTEMLSSALLREVFGIEADVLIDPRTGVPLCVPYALTGGNLMIKPEELQTLEATILDVRSSEEFAAGHVEGAKNIPLADLPRYVSTLPKDKPIVTYCMMKHPGDSRGEKAAALLREQGFDATVLEGGLPAYERAGLPVSTKEKV